MVSIAAFNALGAAALFFIALAGAATPLLLSRRAVAGAAPGCPPTRSRTYALGNCLSAGVMLSAGWVHLLGSSEKALSARASGFPLAPALCGVGFLATLVADHLAAALAGGGGRGTSVATAAASGSDGGGGAACPGTPLAARLVEVVVSGGGGDGTPAKGEPAGLLHGHLPHQPAVRTASFEVEGGRGLLLPPPAAVDREALLPPSQRASSAGAAPGGGAGGAAPANPRAATRHRLAGEAAAPSPAALPPCCAGPASAWVNARPASAGGVAAATAAPAAAAYQPASFLTAALMAGALCFHSVLEGAAQGAQPGVADAAHIFVAVAAHKGLAAYALGAAVVDAGAVSGPRFWGTVGAFAAATPLGIAAGALLAGLAAGGAAAAVSALAAGTFVYVAAMEVIPRELGGKGGGGGSRGRGDDVAAKLGALCAGFGLMTLLAVWA